MPDYLSTVYCTFADMTDLLSEMGVNLRLDDDDDGVVTGGTSDTATTGERLWQRKAINWATTEVNNRCRGRYAAAGLATSWTINDWATILACWRLCRRRLNPNPLQSEFERVKKEMLDLQEGRSHLADIGMLESCAPGIDNFRIDHRFITQVQRVLPSISDTTPTPGRTPARDVTDTLVKDWDI